MKIEKLLRQYEAGELSRGDFVGLMPNVTKETIEQVLGVLPPEVLELLARHASGWEPGAKLLPPIHGGTPTTFEERELIREWLRARSLLLEPSAVPEWVEVDVSGVMSIQDLRVRLAAGLGFPEFYGRNWDVFSDGVRRLSDTPRKVVIVGWGHVVRNWPREAGVMEGCLEELKKEPERMEEYLEELRRRGGVTEEYLEELRSDVPKVLCEWELRG